MSLFLTVPFSPRPRSWISSLGTKSRRTRRKRHWHLQNSKILMVPLASQKVPRLRFPKNPRLVARVFVEITGPSGGVEMIKPSRMEIPKPSHWDTLDCSGKEDSQEGKQTHEFLGHSFKFIFSHLHAALLLPAWAIPLCCKLAGDKLTWMTGPNSINRCSPLPISQCDRGDASPVTFIKPLSAKHFFRCHLCLLHSAPTCLRPFSSVFG